MGTQAHKKHGRQQGHSDSSCLLCALSRMACHVWRAAATDKATAHLLQPHQRHHPPALAQLVSAHRMETVVGALNLQPGEEGEEAHVLACLEHSQSANVHQFPTSVSTKVVLSSPGQ